MNEGIVTSLISALASVIGVWLINNKFNAVIEERITNLTKEVEKHNKVVERTYALESKVDVLEERIKAIEK